MDEDLFKIFNSGQFFFGKREAREIMKEEAEKEKERKREIAELERMLRS